MPPDVAKIAKAGQQLANDRLGLAAVRTLEVAVLDDVTGAFFGPRTWSRSTSTGTARSTTDSEVPSSARSLRPRGSIVVTRNTSHVASDAHTTVLSTPSLASSRSIPRKASVAISNDTVKPIPAIVPPPITDAQPTGGRSLPRLSRVTIHVEPAIPTRLTDDVGDDYPERDRRAVRAREKAAVDLMPSVGEREQGTIT